MRSVEGISGVHAGEEVKQVRGSLEPQPIL
jgi:hypothetical protein